jgi:hypothetical protein
MEVSGQLHAPAALPQGKSPWYPLDSVFHICKQILTHFVFIFLQEASKNTTNLFVNISSTSNGVGLLSNIPMEL